MNNSEDWRRETEAREWLLRTQGNPLRINQLLQRIAAKRGQQAADQLRDAMRLEYRRVRSGADSGAER